VIRNTDLESASIAKIAWLRGVTDLRRNCSTAGYVTTLDMLFTPL